jgi:hypothetical protein
MNRILVSVAATLAFGIAVLWAAGQIEQAAAPELPALMPDGALLYIQAKDLSTLLGDWNRSAQKRAWLAGDDYQEFSRSRLFERLSQAQDEFSAAAGIPADSALLNAVAGTQSGLALYDIGNLQFLYVTRMSQHDAENTPLWALHSRFEPRSEGAVQFYVRQDPQSKRTAAFAADKGWLILGTSADLVAGALDRLQLPHERSVAGEAWYIDSVRQAPGPPGDLRMVLNLSKLVPSPYFRSYWVQQNLTEMKQYGSAVSDLYRSPKNYREERVLLRKPGQSARAAGDVSALSALAPPGSDFYSAQAAPDPDTVLTALRDNLLEVKPATVVNAWDAPPPATDEHVGSVAMLDVRIDQAPVVVSHADPYEPLRNLLRSAQLSELLKVGSVVDAHESEFVHIQSAMVLEAQQPWTEPSLQQALTAALQPGLTAGRMGIGWVERSGRSGSYLGLDGQVPLYAAIRQNLLFLANDAEMLDTMLARQQNMPAQQQTGLTHIAVFRHGQKEQQDFTALFARLDRHQIDPSAASGAQVPPFFSGNSASLSRMFTDVDMETLSEHDEGAKVLQTVSYEWTQ